MSGGRVILVGAGPGDPSLVTLRGIHALQAAEVVVYDRLARVELLAWVPHDAERIDVGKAPGSRKITQEEIHRILIEKARSGKTVVRLKGGDPFVFGRGGEEIVALLKAGVPFEVVPGVTAGVAAPACAGIPLTHRGLASCVTFVTGHEDPAKTGAELDYAALAATGGTLVFYMGVAQLPKIVSKLMQAGLAGDTPAACIERGTTPEQRSVRGGLADIARKAAEAGIAPPAVTVIGAVAGLPEELNWFERRPLFARRIVVTRPPDQAADMTTVLCTLGARVLSLPAIEIAEPPSWEEIDAALDTLADFDWVVFTSVNAVWVVIGSLEDRGRDARAFAGTRVAAMGPATADALIRHGILPDLVPDEFLTTALVKALGDRHDLRGSRVLLPRSSIARKELSDGLRDLGADVTEVTAYVTRTNTRPDTQTVEAVRRGECDLVTFTSSSTVRGFVEIVGAEAIARLKDKVLFASIGPVTSATARELGIPVTTQAREHTTDGLVKAILDTVTPA